MNWQKWQARAGINSMPKLFGSCVAALQGYPEAVTFPSSEIAALLVAVSFAAGLNVYGTVATLGLMAEFKLVPLPGQLHLLQNWWIIGVSGALFVVEFFADKIPAFDLIWNAAHTFIRVPVAALLAFAATSHLSPEKQLAATVVGGLIAFAAHGGKTAVRTAVTPSPEPFSNMTLSFSEDALAIFLTWFATKHPYWAAAIAIVFLVIIVFLIRWIVRAMKGLFRGGVPVNSRRSLHVR